MPERTPDSATEARLRSIFRAAPIGIGVVCDRVLTEVNTRLCQMLGYAAEELRGQSARLVYPSDEEFEYVGREKYAQIRQRGAGAVETRFRCKDGRIIDVLLSSTPLDPDDLSAGVTFTALDITGRKQGEAELRRERDTAQRYLDIAGVMIVTLDARGDVTLINRKGADILGYPEEEIVGTNWLERFVPPRMRAEVQGVLAQLMAGTGEPAEHRENPVVARGGEERLIAWHNTLLRDADGRIVGTLSSGEDITEHKRAEEALRFTQFAVDHSADAAFWVAPDARILYANEAACRSLGYTQAELLRMTVYDIDPDFPAEVWPAHWQALRRRRSLTVVSHHRTKDGRVFPVEVVVNFVEFQGRQYHCAFVRDISQRQHAEEEHRRLEAQLRHAQKMEAVGQLAGGVAHDFNNILTAIIGNTELALDRLRETMPADDAAVEGLEAVERAAQRAASLTRRLLVFSRRDVAKPEVLELNRTLREMESMLRRLISENTRLNLALAPDLPAVLADVGQIEQVIMNLVVNARDAMPDGGELTIGTASVLLDALYVQTHAESRVGPHALLTVSDTGCGMDAGTAERIFEPFFTTKPAGLGTGLGLATVYAIVKQAGGHINVYSEPGRGSTFRIYLPVAEIAAERPAGALPEEPLPGGTEAVLLCEDDETVRHLAAHLLAEAGYAVLAAEGGQQALRLAAAHRGPLHLLITDVIMPDVNGRKLADLLVAAQPGLKVLFMSGYTSNIIAHHGVLDAGVEFMEKPFSRRTFLIRVREVLDKPASARP